nr:importin alpha [Cryptomonas paramecium]
MNNKENQRIFEKIYVHNNTKKKDNSVNEKRNLQRENFLMEKRKEKLFLKTKETILSDSEQLPFDLFKLKEDLASGEIETQKKALIGLRRMLSVEKNPPIQQIINFNLVNMFIDILKHYESVDIKFEIVWILTNIASGTNEQTSAVVKSGAIPILATLIQHENENLKEQAMWALGNIAGDSHKHRDLVLNNHVLDIILREISLTTQVSFLRIATWTLSNFCRGKPRPSLKYIKNILIALKKIIFSEDTEILSDSCWALSYISEEKIELVTESGILQRIIELLTHSDFEVQTPALRTIGNIVSGDDTQTQLVLNCSILPCLLILLNSPKKAIKKEACWTLSNIAAGNSYQIQALIDNGFFPILVYILKNADVDIKKEAAWSICNAILGGQEIHVTYLIKQGCLKPLLDLLEFADVRLIRITLESIETILKIGKTRNCNENKFIKAIEQAGTVEKLEILQHHKNNTIYEKSLAILEKYFECQESLSDHLSHEYTNDTLRNIQQIPDCSFDFS